MLILVGAPGIVDSFARFALEGLGTRAPIAPPQKLVVTGLYRYVRNPIYITVVAVILGQALFLGDRDLLWYGALVWLFFHVWVVMIEEPTLKQTFGTEYESFRTKVPRWVPRPAPWRDVRCRNEDPARTFVRSGTARIWVGNARGRSSLAELA